MMTFAKAIACKIAALNELDLTSTQRARIRESISDDIKKCTNFVIPEVSCAAHEEAERRGVDLFSMNWHGQPRFDPRRKTFHFEHILPVSAIRDMYEDIKTEEEIYNILKTCLRVVWILKREDAELTNLGFRSKRADPEAAYRAAKIQLMNR
jgi:hypothetical protein